MLSLFSGWEEKWPPANSLTRSRVCQMWIFGGSGNSPLPRITHSNGPEKKTLSTTSTALTVRMTCRFEKERFSNVSVRSEIPPNSSKIRKWVFVERVRARPEPSD